MFRRPNTTPVQAEHAGRQSARVRRSGPEQSAGTKNARDFLDQQARFAQMFKNLGCRDHVEMLRRKLCLLQLTVKDVETERAHVFSRLLRDVETLSLPTVFARGEQ